jgi:hypothetical protein
MTESRNSGYHTKVRRQEKYYAAASAKGGVAAAMAGRGAYREEFERDHGPDLDESLDGTETAHEF